MYLWYDITSEVYDTGLKELHLQNTNRLVF